MVQHHLFLAVGLGAERAEFTYPNVTTRHKKTPGVAFISLRKVFGANPATFPECGALLESNESLMCSVAV